MVAKCGIAWDFNQPTVATRLTTWHVKIDKSMPHRQTAVKIYRNSAVEYLLCGKSIAAMRTSEITPDDIMRLLNSNGFADLVGNQTVNVAPQEQLNRALALACRCGHVDLARELHDRGAEIRSNAEPLNAAADYDHPEIAKFLIEHGADVNGRARMFGETALMTAAGSASVEVFQLLLARGANPQAVDSHGANALTWANNGRHTAALPEMGAEPNVIADYDAIIQTFTDSST